MKRKSGLYWPSALFAQKPDISTSQVEKFWPLPLRRLGKGFVFRLDAETFVKLCQNVRRRARRTSKSKKHAREVAQKLIRRRYPYPLARGERQLLNVKIKHSPLVEAFCPDRAKLWVSPRLRRRRELISLERFSFIDDPVRAFQAFQKLAAAETDCVAARLDFSDTLMLDIAPYVVLGLLMQSMAPFVFGGRLPPNVRAAIEATELNRLFHMMKDSRAKASGNIFAFKLRRGGRTDSASVAHSPSTKENVTKDLINQINSWLSQANSELTREGEAGIGNLCNEILENAERHSGPDEAGHWTVAGLMQKLRRRPREDDGKNAPEHVLVCSIAFVNLGEAISKTIARTQSPQVESDLREYVRLHSRVCDEDVLATLFATQDGMTRTHQTGSTPGGLGLMTAVEAVRGLSDAEVENGHGLAIISGSAYIKFVGDFLNCLSLSEDSPLRFQWLNAEKTPARPPDQAHAFSLPISFPGTIISARFLLNGAAVESKDDGRADD